MKYIIIFSVLFLSYCTNNTTSEFTSLIQGKTYNTWTIGGTLIPTQIYNTYKNGRLIVFTDTNCPDLIFTYTYITALDNNHAIYLQHSPAPPLFFAFILEDNGNEVFTAFNPDQSNTNHIDWNTKLNFMKVP